MAYIPLNVTASATFSAGGSGAIARCQLGPQIFGVNWKVNRVIVSTTVSNPDIASQCKIYRNYEADAQFFFGTTNGENDSNADEFDLYTLEKLIFVWDTEDTA